MHKTRLEPATRSSRILARGARCLRPRKHARCRRRRRTTVGNRKTEKGRRAQSSSLSEQRDLEDCVHGRREGAHHQADGASVRRGGALLLEALAHTLGLIVGPLGHGHVRHAACVGGRRARSVSEGWSAVQRRDRRDEGGCVHVSSHVGVSLMVVTTGDGGGDGGDGDGDQLVSSPPYAVMAACSISVSTPAK